MRDRDCARECARCLRAFAFPCLRPEQNADLPDQSLRTGRWVNLVQKAYGIGLARPVHRSEPFGLDRQLHSCHGSDHHLPRGQDKVYSCNFVDVTKKMKTDLEEAESRMRRATSGAAALMGGAAILGAVLLVADTLPAHPRVLITETSLRDDPGVPLSLDTRHEQPALDASLAKQPSLRTAQSLMYIPPDRPDKTKLGDFFDFQNACKQACPSATVAREHCGADQLTDSYLAYRDKCRQDWHGCACQIRLMYCGGQHKTKVHPQYAEDFVCK